MDQPGKFRFLTPAQYAGLDFKQRDRYLQEALKELARRLNEAATRRERGAQASRTLRSARSRSSCV